ncbi:MAG TPA: endonuclease domain-containing protein, partial [Polyangiaceae bacterium]
MTVARWKALNKPAVAASAKKRNSKPEVQKRRRDRQRERYRNDPEYREKTLQSSRAAKQKLTPEQKYDRGLRNTYGVSADWARRQLEHQGGVCLLCGAPIECFGRGGTAGVVDHCRRTGAIRGILHGACNGSLGHYEAVREKA